MVRYRFATVSDAVPVAALHAESWRKHYRGVLSDEFLDNAVVEERRSLWMRRLQSPTSDQFLLLAEENEVLIGFLCAYLHHDKTYGALLDNLHVSLASKGKGVGTTLMKLLAEKLQERGLDKMYLWVLEQNAEARGFYESLGGVAMETVEETEVGDGLTMKTRIYWESIQTLLE